MVTQRIRSGLTAREERGARRVFAWRLGGAVLVILASAWPGHGQVRDLDALGQEAAAAIDRDTRDLSGTAQVLVFNFQPIQLGERVADSFDAALKKTQHEFSVLDRDSVLAKRATETGDYTICRKGPAAPNMSVEGELRNIPGGTVEVSIRVVRGKDRKLIFEGRATLAYASDVFHPESDWQGWPAALHGRVAWVRSASDTEPVEKPIRMPDKDAEQQGYKMLTCIRCPQPQFSDAAVKAHYQGAALFDVEINAAGQPVAVSVVKALPCGLTPKAVNAVKGWKFAPATGPDGIPVAVLVPIEVVFRLY